MKGTVLILFVAGSLLCRNGYAQAEEPDNAVRAPAAPDASALKTQKERLSYALGMNLGSEVRTQSMDVDLDLVVRGLQDARAGRTLMTRKEALAVVQAYKRDQKKTPAPAEAVLSAKNLKEGEEFLAENKGKGGVVTLPSGLQYRILKAGEGKKPGIDDTVVVHYRGAFIDGKEFASSYKIKKPATLAVRKAIQGWAEALQLMPAGSKWELFVPPQLAYGERGSRGRIGPNATLIFEVELLSINEKAAARSQEAPLAEITISYKLDSRLTQGLYMGERWVSPATYKGVQDGENLIVVARADGRNARGETVDIRPEWKPADPEMVTVTPGAGGEAKITVLRPGETVLDVASNGLSRRLRIKAEYQNNVLIGYFSGETP